ncbi:MAG TPA: hypothetical protein VJ962_06280 [Clostridia bacterium]|nr:hypothetical protein [Clostridia bacterium]
MVKRSIKSSIIIINHILQFSILIGLSYLQSLTNTKALVMRHLYQRNLDFESHFLSDFGLIVQNIFLFILLVSVVFYLRKVIEKDRRYIKIIESILFIILIIIMLGVINLDFFKNLLVYGYLILGLYLVILIQSMNIKIVSKEQKE